MLDALLLATGLALDCMAVAAATSAARHDRAQALRMAAVFAGFHVAMAGTGAAAGAFAERWIASWDHWLAFGLLIAVGGNMIVSAIRGVRPPQAERQTSRTLIVLAIATSIDAVAAGVTLPLLDVSLGLAFALLGGVTFAMTLGGVLAGAQLSRIGRRFSVDRVLEALGGIAIIAIGVRVVVDHLR